MLGQSWTVAHEYQKKKKKKFLDNRGPFAHEFLLLKK